MEDTLMTGKRDMQVKVSTVTAGEETGIQNVRQRKGLGLTD